MFKSMMLIAVLLACGVVTGCKPQSSDEGYRLGDTTRMVLEAVAELQVMKNDWCQHQNALARDMLLAVVRAYKPDYPQGGLCSDESLLMFLAKQSAAERSKH